MCWLRFCEMAFPERLLNTDETVVADVRPHWSFVFGPVFSAFIAVAGTIALLIAFSGIPSWAEMAMLVAIVVCLAWMAGRYLRWSTTSLVVTNQRVVYRSGVIARHGREIPLAKLNDLAVSQSIGQRLVGAGRLFIESAGERGEDSVPPVPRPAEIQRTINREIDLYHRRHAMAGSVQVMPSVPEQLEKLDELCRRGVVTSQEFAAKKADLLRRM